MTLWSILNLNLWPYTMINVTKIYGAKEMTHFNLSNISSTLCSEFISVILLSCLIHTQSNFLLFHIMVNYISIFFLKRLAIAFQIVVPLLPLMTWVFYLLPLPFAWLFIIWWSSPIFPELLFALHHIVICSPVDCFSIYQIRLLNNGYTTWYYRILVPSVICINK